MEDEVVLREERDADQPAKTSRAQARFRLWELIYCIAVCSPVRGITRVGRSGRTEGRGVRVRLGRISQGNWIAFVLAASKVDRELGAAGKEPVPGAVLKRSSSSGEDIPVVGGDTEEAWVTSVEGRHGNCELSGNDRSAGSPDDRLGRGTRLPHGRKRKRDPVDGASVLVFVHATELSDTCYSRRCVVRGSNL